MPIDVESIINGTPQKVFNNKYQMMTENYTPETANAFAETYKDASLSFILENSRKIFSEPSIGFPFYKEIVETVGYCDFLQLESERDKIAACIEEMGTNVPEDQKASYQKMLESVESILDNTIHTRIVAESLETAHPGFHKAMCDALYAEDVNAFMEAASGDDTLYQSAIITYGPYIASMNVGLFKEASDRFMHEVECERIEESADDFRTFAFRSVCGNKARLDTLYEECEAYIPKMDRIFFKSIHDVNLLDTIESTRVHVPTDTFANPQTAVNSVFTDIMENAVMDSFYSDKERFSVACEATLAVAENDYADDSFNASAYTLFKRPTYDQIMRVMAENSDFFVEAESLILEASDDSLRKMEKPGLTTRIQNKAMDLEKKELELAGKMKEGYTKVRNSVKAVTRLPLNIANSIKDVAHKLDEADDARRKAYMTEPGFRKKIYRNMKLSLMYTTALSTRLSLFPVLLVARHASKQKDVRIRNECYRELQTEMKICDEKINDANATGDNKEKYRLMRIKEQLNAEAIRVRTNSNAI